MGFPISRYLGAIGRMRPTHRSDRSDHSPNRPHAAAYERRNAFPLTSHMRPTLRPTMNRPLVFMRTEMVSEMKWVKREGDYVCK